MTLSKSILRVLRSGIRPPGIYTKLHTKGGDELVEFMDEYHDFDSDTENLNNLSDDEFETWLALTYAAALYEGV